jgi:hypothetical protein
MRIYSTKDTEEMLAIGHHQGGIKIYEGLLRLGSGGLEKFLMQ